MANTEQTILSVALPSIRESQIQFKIYQYPEADREASYPKIWDERVKLLLFSAEIVRVAATPLEAVEQTVV